MRRTASRRGGEAEPGRSISGSNGRRAPAYPSRPPGDAPPGVPRRKDPFGRNGGFRASRPPPSKVEKKMSPPGTVEDRGQQDDDAAGARETGRRGAAGGRQREGRFRSADHPPLPLPPSPPPAPTARAPETEHEASLPDGPPRCAAQARPGTAGHDATAGQNQPTEQPTSRQSAGRIDQNRGPRRQEAATADAHTRSGKGAGSPRPVRGGVVRLTPPPRWCRPTLPLSTGTGPGRPRGELPG